MTTEEGRHDNRRGVASRKLVRDELSGVSFVISSGRRNLSVGVTAWQSVTGTARFLPRVEMTTEEGRHDNRG